MSNKKPKKGASLQVKGTLKEPIVDFLRQALDKGCFESILIPVKVPADDSFAWVLLKDKSLLGNAEPLPAIMPVQGAKALSSITKHGSLDSSIAVVMRPCEMRAAIELSKLKQLEFDNVIFITMDCPGVIPLGDWFKDPAEGAKTFEQTLQNWDDKAVRPVCQICDKFSAPMTEGEEGTYPDIHIGTLGAGGNNAFVIPYTSKGEEVLQAVGLSVDSDITTWAQEVEKLSATKAKRRADAHTTMLENIGGTVNLPKAFSLCINCHNCMKVCPVCYCQHCYFESDTLKHSADTYFSRASKKGSLHFKPDSILFHVGRMAHMTLSCVSCGSCEDACPMDIEVAQIFSAVAAQTQRTFNYLPGENIDTPIPVRIFEEEKELDEVETMCKDVLEETGEE